MKNFNDNHSDTDEEPPLLVVLEETNEDSVPTNSDTTTTTTSPRPPCPVTILAGFLGAGKSTLVNYILKSPDHGKRIAVIENEFGDGLDVEAIIAKDGASNQSLTEFIELPNGCVCCTVKDSLVTTLEILLEKRAELDYIIIECSGMANPGPIASLFWLDEALGSRLRLDSIVTICDAAHIVEHVQTTEEAIHQIAYADRILLNKVDLVSKNAADSIVSLIRQFHPSAPIRQTEYSSVPDLDWILDARCFDTDRFQTVQESLEVPLTNDDDEDELWNHNHSHDHDHEADTCHACQIHTHKHTSGIASFSIVGQGTFDLQLLNRWLASLLWPNQDATNKTLQELISDETKIRAHQSVHDNTPRIFRMKGIVSVRQYEASDTFDPDYVDNDMIDKRRFILQSVHDLWELHPATDGFQWDADDKRLHKVVVIGKNLDESQIRQGFNDCLAIAMK